MSKIKIEINLDIDFQKFFNEIPDGLYKCNDSNKTDDADDTDDADEYEYYEKSAIYSVLRDCYTNALMKKIEWMTNEHYEYAKHHLLIEEEIAKQIANNGKITFYEK